MFVLAVLLGCPTSSQPIAAETVPEGPPSPLADQPFEALPRDGLAEVARYRFARSHYGVDVEGRATLLVVRESLDEVSLLKTNQGGGAPAIKLMLMKTLPSMNWDHRDNFALYSAEDLKPLKLAITAEEWCGNNFLEWRDTPQGAQRIGRPYTDDTSVVTDTVPIATGYHLYEQLPLLVRAATTAPLELRLVGPQTAYLPPHADLLDVTLAPAGTERLTTPAGTFETVRVDVTPQAPTFAFPSPESYWLDKDQRFVVKAERHEYGTEFGKPHVTTATYTLLDHERSAYWSSAVGPATAELSDRVRATSSSAMQIALQKATADRRGSMFSLDNLPAEYLSDPAGNRNFSGAQDGKGGWTVDAAGRFVPNVP